MKYRDIFHVAYVDRMKLNCREMRPNIVWFRITEIFPMQSMPVGIELKLPAERFEFNLF